MISFYARQPVVLITLLFSLGKLGGVPVQCFAVKQHLSTAGRRNTNFDVNINGGGNNYGVNSGITSLARGQKIRNHERRRGIRQMVSVASDGDKNNVASDGDKNNQKLTNHEEISIRGGETNSNSNSNLKPNSNSNSNPQSTIPSIRKLPCGDELDKKLVKIAIPTIANFAINPLVGAVDLFWINRTGNPLAVAGQAAANQIFTSSFWLTSFLPAVTATLVAKEAAKGDEEGVQDSVCQAFIVGTMIAIVGTIIVLSMPDQLLTGVLSAAAPAREFARPYLLVRGFGFLPSMYSLIGFSSFRGVMDTLTPLKISIFANLMNAVLDPILIFWAGMGVTGAALATLAAELTSAILFVCFLSKRNMIKASKIFRMPDVERLKPLLKGGAALQLRNFALNLTFLAVTRVTQSIDQTGVSAAAHAMAIQTFQIGGIVLLALSTVAQFLVPGEMVEKVDKETGEVSGGSLAARGVVNRLMSWGLILGTILGALQVAILPNLLNSTPIQEVREAARLPAIIGSFYQCFNGLVFIGEGVMVGTGSFLQLSISTLIATIATLGALNTLPQRFGLTGVWMSFGVFNSLRLTGVAIHQLYNGPLSRRVIARKAAEKA
jgi:putative MATE family efflux protein